MDIKSLKDKILQLAIQGKLVPQDENDESASVLIERIKAEKEQLIKDKVIKKEKPLPEISDEEIPYELPASWKWTRLGDITNYGKNISIRPESIQENTWVLELEDIERDTSKILQRILFKDRKSKSTKLIFKENDVLYCKLRPYLNKVVVVDNNGVCSSEIMPIRGYYGIYPKYLMYALKRQDFLKYVNNITYGSKMPRLGTEDGRKSLFPLPPLEEQKRIVAKVDELFKLIDELDNNKQELLENMSNTRNKVLQLAIQGKLVEQCEDDEPASVLLERIKAEKEQLVKDKIIKKEKPLPEISEEEKDFDLPKGWEWCRLGQLYNIVRGSSPRPKGHPKYFTESKTEYSWVTIKDITLFLDGKYLYNTNEYLTYEGSLKSRFIKSGEIIIAVSGSIGKTAIMGIDGYIYDGLAGLKNIVNNEILRDYVYIALNAWKEHLNNISEGTSIQNINTEKLNLLKIALPPLEEQKRIVEKFDLIMDYLDKLQQEIESQEVILEDILN